MGNDFEHIDFKLVFNKLLEINERSVEQLIRFKDMLSKNNEQFDHIIDKISMIVDKFKTFETALEIMKNRKILDKIDDIDKRTEDEFKNMISIFGELKSLINEILQVQLQFKQDTKDELKEITNTLNSVSKNQESFSTKYTTSNDDIKEIKRILDEFNKKVLFDNKLNKVINGVATLIMALSAWFLIFKK